MLCKAGGINKRQLGSIRIQQRETHVEIDAASIDKFFSNLGRDGHIEKQIYVTRLDGPPQQEARPQRAERAERGPPQRERTERTERAPPRERPQREERGPPQRSERPARAEQAPQHQPRPNPKNKGKPKRQGGDAPPARPKQKWHPAD
jgi:ATP-dependent RNA helicase DeaD